MAKATTQQRGICQCCGRQQAVMASGKMSKHGYTVQDGWFSGVCSGQDYVPMQVSVEQTKVMCALVQEQVDDLRARAAMFEAGELMPERCNTGNMVRNQETGKYEVVTVAWADALPFQRAAHIRNMVWGMQNRANAGSQWITNMQELAAKYHGQPLLVVAKETGPEPIPVGDARVYRGKTVQAASIERGSVWVVLGGGSRFRVTTRAWRLLPKP